MQVVERRDPTAIQVMADLAKTLSRGQEHFVEIAQSRKGSSAFNRCIYYPKLTGEQLFEISGQEKNLAFLGDIERKHFSPVLHKETNHSTSQRHMRSKKIISFDLDFKDLTKEFEHWPRSVRWKYAMDFVKPLLPQLQQQRIPLWLLVFTGGGIHLHFKLNQPLPYGSAENYRENYKRCCRMLEQVLGGKFQFDRACSNPARLMRLPFSVNHKLRERPVPTEVWHWDADADASHFFRQLQAPKPMRTELEFEAVLRRFGYTQFDSFETKGDELICPSPFAAGSSGSLHYNRQKNVYFDFATSEGGNLHQLVQRLAKQHPEVEVSDLKRSAQPRSFGLPPNFQLDKDGVWWLRSRGPDEDPERLWLCAPLKVVALTRDLEAHKWGRVLEFHDADGNRKEWTVPVSMLAGDGLELRTQLLDRGLTMALKRSMRTPLMEYILLCRPLERMHCVDKIGWHEGQYVLPDESFGNKDDIRLQTTGDTTGFEVKGSLEDWQENVAQHCKGQSRLMLAVSAGFTPPSLHLKGAESGGLHFVGSSSIGKTLTLKTAASVWGCGPNQNLVRKWRSTVNGLEHLAESSNDSLLVLDELAEIGSKSAGQAAYMLANGSGKQRLNKDGKAKKCARWRTLFLSSGEIGLAEHLGETGEQMRGGQHIRLVDIEADAGQGHGVFDFVPEGTSAAELADTLSLQTARYGGAPIRAYLKLLTQDTDIPAALTRYEQAFLHAVEHTRLTRQARRVAKRFALIAASGCYAASQGILPWSAEENMAAVQACFESWWAQQPVAEDFEETRALEQVRSFLENNAYSHFPEANTLRLGGYQGKFTGFREKNPDGEWEWFVLASCFSEQVCKGLKVRQVTKVLRKHNCLYLQDNRSTKAVRCPGQGLKRMYHFRAGALNIPYAEEMEGGGVTAVTADTVLPQGADKTLSQQTSVV